MRVEWHGQSAFTLSGEEHTAAEIAQELGAVWVVPMHYRTPRVGFLESEEEFVAAMPRVERLDGPSFETADLERAETPTAVVPAAP